MRSTLFSKRKLVTLFLAALLGVSSISEARDSTALAQESVMTSRLTRSHGHTPVGAIVAFPQTGNLSADVSDDWCECDGRAVPRNSDAYKYYGITRTPNLYADMGTSGRGYFLRAGATPQQTSADKFESHLHGQPEHTHSVSGKLVSTAITAHLTEDKVEGKAAPQQVDYQWTWWHWGPSVCPKSGNPANGNWVPTTQYGGASWVSDHSHSYWNDHPSQTGGGGGHYHSVTLDGGGVLGPQTTRAVSHESAVTAKVTNTESTGHVNNARTSGTAHASGGDNTYSAGQDETAPTYFTTRYFMRIND